MSSTASNRAVFPQSATGMEKDPNHQCQDLQDPGLPGPLLLLAIDLLLPLVTVLLLLVEMETQGPQEVSGLSVEC